MQNAAEEMHGNRNHYQGLTATRRGEKMFAAADRERRQ